MQQFLQDSRFSLRMIRKNPIFFLVLILTLSLGIGANTAIFSVVNSVILRSLPYSNADRLLWITEERKSDRSRPESRIANFLDWREQNQVFEHLAHYTLMRFTLSFGGEPEAIPGASTSANFFRALGEEPFIGRGFLPEEGEPGAAPVVILSYALWQERFGGDESWLGRSIDLDATAHTIIGVMPLGFEFAFPKEQRLWASRVFTDYERENRDNYLLTVLGLLKEGVSLAQAQEDMDLVTLSLAELHPRVNEGWGVWMKPFKDYILGGIDAALFTVLGCVTVVLLIACANVINLLLARGTVRERELAMRVAMGAGRGRLVRHFLAESLVLCSLGALGGLLFASLSMELLVALGPRMIPRLDELSIDGRVLAFTLLVSVLVTVILGLVMSFKAFRLNLLENIKPGGVQATKEIGIFRVRNLVVAIEVGLVLALVVFGILLVESYLKVSLVDPGFEKRGRIAMEVSLPRADYPDSDAIVPFFEELQRKVAALPGVEAVAATTNLPLTGSAWVANYMIAGNMSPESRVPRALFDFVSIDYFEVMGIPLLKGRLFRQEDRAGAQETTIVNRRMANKHWTVDTAVGEFLYVGDLAFEIIGVVEDVKYQNLQVQAKAKFYRPNLQMTYPTSARQLIIWTKGGNPSDVVPVVRNAVLEIDDRQPIAKVVEFEELVSNSISHHRFNMVLFIVFGLIGLFLGGVGVYGVVSYSVARRTREMGIRLSMGARRFDVLKMIVGTELIPVLAGVVLGIGLCFALTQTIAKLLYQVSASDPIVYFGVSCALCAIAVLAIYIPAFKASRVDPMMSVRYE